MEAKIVKKSIIAKTLGVEGIVLYPFIFFSDANPGPVLINHEMIHISQIKKNGILRFYLLYLKEYFVNRLKGMKHNEAYFSISFEKEAYQNPNKSIII